MENITINKKELENFLYYLADKSASCYKQEISIAINRFLEDK